MTYNFVMMGKNPAFKTFLVGDTPVLFMVSYCSAVIKANQPLLLFVESVTPFGQMIKYVGSMLK